MKKMKKIQITKPNVKEPVRGAMLVINAGICMGLFLGFRQLVQKLEIKL